VLPLVRHLSRLDEITLSDCQIAARHFIEAKYLTESGSKDQRNAILLRAGRICDGTVRDHQTFPAMIASRALDKKK